MVEGKAKSWTVEEKVDFFIQIVEKNGTIPWDELKLPEGRTKKAVQVMIDREKQRIRKALAEGGKGAEAGDGDDDNKAPKMAAGKRKAAGDAHGAPEKAKAPRKKKVKAGEDDMEDELAAAPEVKAEPESEDA